MIISFRPICTSFFLSFYKYWPDDGLFKPKLVANIWNNKLKDSCDRRSTYFVSF
jgi:hypothetical protein